MAKRRVVISGVGVVSSIGIGKDMFWRNLLDGTSGISPITAFDTAELPNKLGGEVKSFSPRDYLKPENIKRYGRASQFAAVASKLAFEDAAIAVEIASVAPAACDVIVGTTMGEIQALESVDRFWCEEGESSIPAHFVSQYPSNVIALNVAYELGLSGKTIVVPTACAAGNYAIGYGCDLIRLGQSNMVLAGGAEAFSRIAYTGFSRLFAMSNSKCAPFDKNRRGMMVGEGSGMLVLESLEHAEKRGARIYAEVLDYALTCDANHMTIPSADGVSGVIDKALKAANISSHQVDYISAHGTGTQMNDKTESQAIKKIFGDKTPNIPVSSIKSMLGHTMGAASAIEAIVCCLAIHDSKIPPTINYETIDESCPIDCVPNTYRNTRVGIALNNSFAFGGNNACVVFAKKDFANG